MKSGTLPSNIEAEEAIFSIILNDPNEFIKIVDRLRVQDFYNITNQELWQALKSLYIQGIELDVVSIKNELQKQKIDYKPAIAVLAKCYERKVFESNLNSFVKEVKNKSLLRQLMGILITRKDETKFDNANGIELLANIEQDIIKLSSNVIDERPIDAQGIVKELKTDIEKNQKGGWKTYNTGFDKLDEMSGGLIPTQCWIVGAYTGTGKTFFLLQIILDVLGQGGKVMLFSTEMDRKMNVLRMLGNLAGLGTINILKGNLIDEEKDDLKEAQKQLSEYGENLIIYDNVYTVEEIRLKAKKHKLQHGLDLIVVDFIQNLQGEPDIYTRMSNAAIDLQRMTQELKLTTILASQVSQSSAGWSSKEVIEYKGAGEIAAIADVGLWIKKIPEDKDIRRVVLRKMRHGVSSKYFDIKLSFPSGKITELIGS